jgi:hypothetical protein
MKPKFYSESISTKYKYVEAEVGMSALMWPRNQSSKFY